MEDRLESQSRDIQRLTEMLSRYMDRNRGAAPVIQTRHAQHARSSIYSREDDIISLLTEPDGLHAASILDEALDLNPATYDPIDIDSVTQREHDTDMPFFLLLLIKYSPPTGVFRTVWQVAVYTGKIII